MTWALFICKNNTKCNYIFSCVIKWSVQIYLRRYNRDREGTRDLHAIILTSSSAQPCLWHQPNIPFHTGPCYPLQVEIKMNERTVVNGGPSSTAYVFQWCNSCRLVYYTIENLTIAHSELFVPGGQHSRWLEQNIVSSRFQPSMSKVLRWSIAQTWYLWQVEIKIDGRRISHNSLKPQ